MNKTIVFAAAALALVACASEPSFEQTEEVGPFTVSLSKTVLYPILMDFQSRKTDHTVSIQALTCTLSEERKKPFL